MGNRAVITTKENFRNNGIGIYVHWNGGRDSVEAFLKYCELKGYGSPEKDDCGFARLTQVIANFFGGTDTVIVDTLYRLDRDNGDNGVYIIEDWKIVDRFFMRNDEQDSYELDEMLLLIDSKMPEEEQIRNLILSKEIPVSELKLGDTIIGLESYSGNCYEAVVIGFLEENHFGKEKGTPYINRYGNDYINNINNYITSETVRILNKKD